MCQGWQQAEEPDKALAAKIAAACSDKPFYGKPAMVKRRARAPRGAPAPLSGFRPF